MRSIQSTLSYHNRRGRSCPACTSQTTSSTAPPAHLPPPHPNHTTHLPPPSSTSPLPPIDRPSFHPSRCWCDPSPAPASVGSECELWLRQCLSPLGGCRYVTDIFSWAGCVRYQELVGRCTEGQHQEQTDRAADGHHSRAGPVQSHATVALTALHDEAQNQAGQERAHTGVRHNAAHTPHHCADAERGAAPLQLSS